MPADVTQTPLMVYLKSRDAQYYGKTLELRDSVRSWLAYIPQSFPHYTQHTAEHSEEMILQVSKLLFRDDNPREPVIGLSAAEAYIIIAAAYLHDAGMVVSDSEKVRILESTDWRTWTSGSAGGARRWAEIQQLRQGPEPADPIIRHFLADLQARFLLAEFVRGRHHSRAGKIIKEHQALLGRFAFDDPVLLRTIADVCEAHGLQHFELEDRDRYPDRRDIMGETVNVKFLAILLRLGDLLDMRFDRACPLLLNAACPLPAQSLAHWTQYQRLVHRLTAPDCVEIEAECCNGEEHRFLQDWCQWLVQEAKNATILMARSTRHSGWKPPVISLDGDGATISIRPAPDAKYMPSRWTFELDRDVIFERLIHDVYDSPKAFVRELLQNVLDATRCQMYFDLQHEGIEPPEYPTQVDEERRLRYPVQVSLRTQEALNNLSGEREERQVLTVDDPGIGMDRDVIQRYFLQTGRSFYTTEEFHRNFRFVATSRYGVGFLSVFAVSDSVTVETYKPTPPQGEGPLRLTLTGPRNYLLTERGERRSNGTRIEVLLRERFSKSELTDMVARWCRRVEFPILIDDLGVQSTIRAERPEEFVCEVPDVTTEGAKFVIRYFPINLPGIEGELYVLGHINADGESWATGKLRRNYADLHPKAVLPPLPGHLACFHGISISEKESSEEGHSERLDLRTEGHQLRMSRVPKYQFAPLGSEVKEAVDSRWQELILEHLSTSGRSTTKDGWKYKQELAEEFDLPSFWFSVPETMLVHMHGSERPLSLMDLQSFSEIAVGIHWQETSNLRSGAFLAEPDAEVPTWDSDVPLIDNADLESAPDVFCVRIFTERAPTRVCWHAPGYLVVYWSARDEILGTTTSNDVGFVVTLPDEQTVARQLHRIGRSTKCAPCSMLRIRMFSG